MKYARMIRQHGLALSWLSGVLLAALTAPTAHSAPDLLHTHAPPFQSAHWLGTTPQGLDVAMGLWQGARTVALVSMPAAVLTLLLGAVLGGAAGFWGDTRLRMSRGPLLLGAGGIGAALFSIPYGAGAAFASLGVLMLTVLWAVARPVRAGSRTWALPIDSLVAGLTSVLYSIPLLVLVVAVAAVQRPSLVGLVALLSGTCWPTPARLMRAATLQSSSQPYVEAARASGISAFRVLWRHIGPNALPVLVVRFPLTVAVLIGLETTLSFLGIGLSPDTPSWGRLLATIRQAPTDWWLLLWPGLVIAGTILSLHQLTTHKTAKIQAL